jgi:hypothetical protein
MSVTWISGSRSTALIQVCPGDLVLPRLTKIAGPGERPGLDGRIPHLVYVPGFHGRDACPGQMGGDSPTLTDPLEYRVDIAPFWCPYEGTIYLDGGGAGGVLPTTHSVVFSRTRLAQRPQHDPTYSLLNITTSSAVPRGAYRVAGPDYQSVEFTGVGGLTTILQVGEQGLHIPAALAGSVRGVGAALDALTFWVRL